MIRNKERTEKTNERTDRLVFTEPPFCFGAMNAMRNIGRNAGKSKRGLLETQPLITPTGFVPLEMRRPSKENNGRNLSTTANRSRYYAV